MVKTLLSINGLNMAIPPTNKTDTVFLVVDSVHHKRFVSRKYRTKQTGHFFQMYSVNSTCLECVHSPEFHVAELWMTGHSYKSILRLTGH